MPTTPSSLKQLAFIHVKAKQGASWAKKTVKEYHGKHFGKLPVSVRHKGQRLGEQIVRRGKKST